MNTGRTPTDAELEASQWIVQLDSPEVSLEDHRRFRAWLAADPAHRAAYEAVSATWDRLDALKSLSPAQTSTSAWPRKRSRRALLLAGIGAGAGVAALLAGYLVWRAQQDRTVYASRTGEIRTVALEDGSSVTLGPATAITAVFSEQARQIELAEGEAYFDVASDAARPFIVVTPFGEARVRGTAFVVRIGATDMRTTVLRGVVAGAARHGGEAEIVAHANEEFALSASGAETTTLDPHIAERRLAWREGMLALDGEPLAEATAEITRHTGVAFSFADPELGHLRLGGYIAANDIDGFLTLLEDNLSIRAAERSEHRIVLAREG